MGSFKPETTVLLVEDDRLVRAVLADALTDHGYHVVEFDDAESAVAYLNEGSRADAVFIDCYLGHGMTGMELGDWIRASRPELPIIFTSGNPNPPGLRPMVSRSMFVPKPYAFDHVGRLVRHITSNA